VNKPLKDEVIQQMDRLDAPQQRQVLDFARGLTAAPAVQGQDLLRFAGSLSPADLAEIAEAIKEGCETVEPNAW
jgi:hypothetical protein